MNSSKRNLFKFALICLGALAFNAQASVDDALSFAHEAAHPYVKQGYVVREDAWGGDLGVKDQQAVSVQLFKGNEYWFWGASDTKAAVLSVRIYDSTGKMVDADSWQKGRFAATRVVPKHSGNYFAIVTIVKSPVERTHWALVYGYR
ncbi:MAG: hypothetical protein ABIP97_10850 [Chthoniobacterales bacterium]